MSDEFEEFAWAAPSVPEIDDAPAPPPPSEPAPEIAADEDGYITFGRPAPPPSTPTTTDAAVSPGESATFQESEPITRRTPHLDLSVPLPLRPGAAFDVLVYADLLAARPAEETEDVVLRAPDSVVSFRLDVWLVATHHFVVTDAPIKSITVRRDEATSSIARFRVAVGGSLEDEEVPLISASFSYNGRPSGRVIAHGANPRRRRNRYGPADGHRGRPGDRRSSGRSGSRHGDLIARERRPPLRGTSRHPTAVAGAPHGKLVCPWRRRCSCRPRWSSFSPPARARPHGSARLRVQGSCSSTPPPLSSGRVLAAGRLWTQSAQPVRHLRQRTSRRSW